jgi:septum formation protein
MQDPKIKKLFHASTEVWMKQMTKAGIRRTVRLTNPLDKAGAYGIQDRPKIVARIEGSYFNVMGLPVERLQAELRMLRLKKALQYVKR